MKTLKSVLLGLFVLLISCLYAQEEFCVPPDTSSSRNGGDPNAKGGFASANGWALPVNGAYKLLIIFVENGSTGGNTVWPAGQLPTFADEIVDPTFPTNGIFQGELTKYFAEASLGDLEITGDYLESPSNGVFTITNAEISTHGGWRNAAINKVNTELGTFTTTANGLIQSDFDEVSNSSAFYQAKGTSNSQYDCTVFIYRNRPGYGNTGNANINLSTQILGWSSDTRVETGPGRASEGPVLILKHEFGHLLFGDNSFHTCGGGGQVANYWIPETAGHSTMGLNRGQSIQTWSAWDQYWCNWKGSNTHVISARTTAGVEEMEIWMPLIRATRELMC